MKKKIVIGMSGGVDSSVAAAFLLDNGYDVVGLTLRTWDNPHDKCGSDTAAEDAAEVAGKLGIEHHIIDVRKEFKETVIDYFINEYKNGRTPNPCVVCNPAIKFSLLMDKGREYGAEYIATGHYANIDCVDGVYMLKNAADIKKDQTYMLYSLSQDQLAHAVFPLAQMSKEETRDYARRLGLTIADKPDSQDVCFIPDGDYVKFIAENSDCAAKPGDFVDETGAVLGRHMGIINYTIGQRKGLGIAFGKPMFVLGIDAKNDTVILGDNDKLFKTHLTASGVSFVSPEMQKTEFRAEAKIRYAAQRAACTVYPTDSGMELVFDTPQRAVTPGQAVVLYDGEYVIGGGIID